MRPRPPAMEGGHGNVGTGLATEVGGLEDLKRLKGTLVMRDARARGIAESPDWKEAMQNVSLVNYATAPLGAKKYDASTLSR